MSDIIQWQTIKREIACPKCGRQVTAEIEQDVPDPFFGPTDEHFARLEARCQCGWSVSSTAYQEPDL